MRCLAVMLLVLLVVVPGAHAHPWNLAAIGSPAPPAHAGAGVVVAVLDSGVAYRNDPPYRRSPALTRQRFVQGFDAIDRDPRPHDRSGHGTHVAATIAAVAPGARIMPVRVLDARGDADELTIARGLRFAIRNGARVVNLSVVFGHRVGDRDLPHLLHALREARRRGVVVVAAAAAVVIAGGVLGTDPSPRAVRLHLREPARDLGEELSPGAGLVDVAAALRAPGPGPAVSRPGGGTARASSGTGS